MIVTVAGGAGEAVIAALVGEIVVKIVAVRARGTGCVSRAVARVEARCGVDCARRSVAVAFAFGADAD